MTSILSVKKRVCPHTKNHSRKLTLERQGVTYEIDSCDTCADFALDLKVDVVEILQN